MFNISDKYKIDKVYKPGDLYPKNTLLITRGDKTRIKKVVKIAILKYQIKGEEIPSLLDSLYNCQTIIFFEIVLDNLRSANFVNKILQLLIPNPCVFKFYDNQRFCFGFADKRLNQQDRKSIIIENTILSKPYAINEDIEPCLNFENIKNKLNKKTFYYELMVKSFFLSNNNYGFDEDKILNSTFWYDENKKMAFFKDLLTLKALEEEKRHLVLDREKFALNQHIAELINKIKQY